MKALARVGCAAVAFVVLATAADAVSGREFALWTGSNVYVTADGHTWRQVTPRGAVRAGTFRAIDAVAFQGAREGWLIASDCAAGRGSVYRSFDGGRHWRAYVFHAHTCAGGANFSLNVLNEQRAWVLQNEPTGPNARVYHDKRRSIVAARCEARDVRREGCLCKSERRLARRPAPLADGRWWQQLGDSAASCSRRLRRAAGLARRSPFLRQERRPCRPVWGRQAGDRLLPNGRRRPQLAFARDATGLVAGRLSPVRSQPGFCLGGLASDSGCEPGRARHARRRAALVEPPTRAQALRAGRAERASRGRFRFSRRAVHHPRRRPHLAPSEPLAGRGSTVRASFNAWSGN